MFCKNMLEHTKSTGDSDVMTEASGPQNRVKEGKI